MGRKSDLDRGRCARHPRRKEEHAIVDLAEKIPEGILIGRGAEFRQGAYSRLDGGSDVRRRAQIWRRIGYGGLEINFLVSVAIDIDAEPGPWGRQRQRRRRTATGSRLCIGVRGIDRYPYIA